MHNRLQLVMVAISLVIAPVRFVSVILLHEEAKRELVQKDKQEDKDKEEGIATQLPFMLAQAQGLSGDGAGGLDANSRRGSGSRRRHSAISLLRRSSLLMGEEATTHPGLLRRGSSFFKGKADATQETRATGEEPAMKSSISVSEG